MSSLAMIKERNRITDIAQHLGLHPDVRNGKGKADCPFCKDQGGHLYIYDDSNRFHCFKCKKSGDWIDLWQYVKNQSPENAISEIKRLYGSNDTRQPTKAQISDFRQPERQVAQIASQMGEKKLTEIFLELLNITRLTDFGQEYLTRRGISDELARRFDIRYIDNPRETGNRMRDKFSLEELFEAGLFDYSPKGKPYFVFFQPAILFPHFSPEFDAITSMSTRNLTGEAKSFKLHNRASTPFYGRIAEGRKLYVFEGIFNALSYAELTGNMCFLAIGGLITPAIYEELRLKHSGHQIVLGLDPDEAGKQALSKIKKCRYIDWPEVAIQMGFPGLQHHPDGKPWDLNDYLVNRR